MSKAQEFFREVKGLAAFVLPDDVTRKSGNAKGAWYIFGDGSLLYINYNVGMKAFDLTGKNFIARDTYDGKQYKGALK
jgi:hypothetical protein